MLVLGKRKQPGLATAHRVDPQEAGVLDGTGILPPLVRLSRPNRETTAVPPPARPLPLGPAAAARTIAAVTQNKEAHMLSATESGDRLIVKCSCGCYSLSAHKPAEPRDSLVRCLICGARARLADLMAGYQARRDRNADIK